jgi:hypothetical protein
LPEFVLIKPVESVGDEFACRSLALLNIELQARRMHSDVEAS